MIEIRKANQDDIEHVVKIYDKIHDFEESGKVVIGWERGVYPTIDTAKLGVKNGDLYVMTDGGEIVASCRINKEQVFEYKFAKWEHEASEGEVMVLHTLTVDPDKKGCGYGKKFVEFYENYALSNGCKYLRIDTNKKNVVARNMYKKLGYTEVGIVPCVFNGIKDVGLVCIEKYLG